MNSSTRIEMLAAATVADRRWAAVVAHDPEADGRFFYSVRTTGVYCRSTHRRHHLARRGLNSRDDLFLQ